MARKSQTNSSRSKTTARARSSSASGNQPQSTATTRKPSGETNASPQSAAPNATQDESIGLDAQPFPPQISEPPHDSVHGINELQQQFAALKNQLETVQSNYIALQQTSTEQARAIDILQGQLEQRKLDQSAQQDSYSILQQKANEQAQTIEQLHDKIAMLDQHMEQRLSEQIIQLKSDAVKSQIVSDTVTLDTLSSVQKQVAGLQTELNHQVMEQMTQQQRYEILRRQCEEQEQVIAELRNLVAQEQHYAAIGEAHLNKWRYRTFSS